MHRAIVRCKLWLGGAGTEHQIVACISSFYTPYFFGDETLSHRYSIGLSMKAFSVSVLFGLCTFLVAGNAVGQICTAGSQVVILDGGGARFPITNGGRLQQTYGGNSADSDNYYVANRQPSIVALSSTTLGVGGYVNGELRMTGRLWAKLMLPGGLDDAGMPPADSSACAAADRIYQVSATDFSRHRDDAPADNISDWPAHLGAPVIDGDGIPNNYNVTGGDRPALVGTQMAWWKMNDGGRFPNLRTYGPPNVGLEIEAFASVNPLNIRVDLTLFRYKIRYVGEAALDSAVVFIFSHPRSGDGWADAAGSDTTAGLGFVFSPPEDYLLGNDAPSVGVMVMRGPAVDDDGIDNDFDALTDETGEELRPTMISEWFDLEEYTEDERGYHMARTGCTIGRVMIEGKGCRLITDLAYSDRITKFWAPDDPTDRTEWEDDLQSYKRFVMISMGPFTWQPGTEKTIEFATLWVHGRSNIDAAHNIRGYAKNLLSIRDQLYEASIPASIRPETAQPPSDYAVSRPYPNPTAGAVNLGVVLSQDEVVEIALFNIVGQEVWSRSDSYAAGTHRLALDIGNLGSGLFYYRVRIRNATSTGTFLIAK